MAYAAYCDTASATKWWIEGTGSAVNRLSEVMDDNASGVEEHDNPGNYQPWTTFMTEVVADAIYMIHLPFEVGDGSTTTVLTSLNEHVYFDGVNTCKVKASATLSLGAVSSGSAVNGSFWSITGPDGANVNFCDGGTINIYNSKVHQLYSSAEIHFDTGHVYIKDSIFSGTRNLHGNDFDMKFRFDNHLTTLEMDNVIFSNLFAVEFAKAPVGDIITSRLCGRGVVGFVDATISNVTIEDSVYVDVYNSGNPRTINMVDSVFSTVDIVYADAVITEQYTCNIHVADKDGANLAGVTIDCVGSDSGAASTEYDTAQWTAGAEVTDASGDLDEQVITAKKWTGTSETLTNYNYFKFTLSKAGYETLVLDAITVDSPIVWHLELLPALAVGDVVDGVSFGEGKTGTYVGGKKVILLIED